MEIKKTDNKSLILYTSLIFLAAIAMIVLSFFGQKHLDDARVVATEKENVNLSYSAAQLSEENRQLVDLNKALKKENESMKKTISELSSKKDALNKEVKGYEDLNKVYEKLLEGNKEEAMVLLSNIYTQDLSSEQKVIYDFLVKQSQEEEVKEEN